MEQRINNKWLNEGRLTIRSVLKGMIKIAEHRPEEKPLLDKFNSASNQIRTVLENAQLNLKQDIVEMSSWADEWEIYSYESANARLSEGVAQGDQQLKAIGTSPQVAMDIKLEVATSYQAQFLKLIKWYEGHQEDVNMMA